MSLETVVEDIRQEAREQAEQIRDAADERAAEIVDEAEADAEEIREGREAEVEREVERLRDQRLSSAKLSAKEERLSARRDVLESVREAVEDHVAELSGEDRRELTAALLDAAAEEFAGAESVAVYGRADDADLLEDLAADHDGFEFAGTYDCLGGVVVESEESRVRVNNTFDSILEEVWDDELKTVSQQLFEQ